MTSASNSSSSALAEPGAGFASISFSSTRNATRCVSWSWMTRIFIGSKILFHGRNCSSLEILHANHYRHAFDDGQPGNLRQRGPHRGMGRVMDHEDERHAFAFVAFGLDHRGNADARPGQNGGDLRKHPR